MPFRDPEKKRANAIRYRAKHQKQIKATQKAYQLANKEKNTDYYRRKNLRTKYGITLEQYNRMFNAQNGCCVVCGVHQSEVKHVFHVDHDHLTGKVRGILCFRCNAALGNVGDSVETLKKMIKYLEQ